MKHERKKVCTAQKIGYFVFLGLLLLAYSLTFWPEKVLGVFYLGAPFHSVLMLAVGFAIAERFWGTLLFLGLYFLLEILLILFFSLGIFRKQKWITPFNILLGIDTVLSPLLMNPIAIVVNIVLVIGANIVVYKLDDAC